MTLPALLFVLQIAAPDSARLAALARFHPGTTVRLQGPTIGVVETRLTRPLGDSITTSKAHPGPRVPLAAVDSIWVLHNGADKSIAILGLTLGLAGGLVGWLKAPDDNSEVSDKAVARGAGIGLVAGVVLGAIIGGASQTWEQIYPF